MTEAGTGVLPGAAGSIRVLIVDDHAMFASSLSVLLGREPDVEVTGTAASLSAARAALATDPPDVVLLDQRLPDGSGVDALAELKQIAPAARVVVLTGAADDDMLVRATEAGCAGFLEKSGSVDELLQAVRSAAAGEVLVSPQLLGRLLRRLHRGPVHPRADLTPRELDVLGGISEGLENSAIADRLGVSVNTVRNHVSNLLAKLGAHSKLEALSIAVREGLLPSQEN